MIIKHRKKILLEINTVSDLESFLIQNNIYKFFRGFQNEFIDVIGKKITDTEYLNYKQIKPWVKSVLNYPESVYQENFLYCMGWPQNEITEFITQKQKNNSLILSDKKQKNPEQYYTKTPTRIEYWIDKGFDLETSKKLLSERQSTFSFEKCVKIHGIEKGEEIFKNRQKKWISTLKEKIDYESIQNKKNSYDYNNNSFKDLISRTSFLKKTKKIILEGLLFDNINSFIDFVICSIDIKRYSDMQPYICSKIIQNKYEVSKDTIRDIFYSKTFYTLTKQTYGVSVYHNGNRFKSIKEYELAIFLEENKVDYVYENYYPNKKYKFDFFLPKYKIYVEYYGMLDGKNLDKLNTIQKFYLDKMEKKNIYCEKENLKLIHNINFNQLINELKQTI
jgi:hypothetical protein